MNALNKLSIRGVSRTFTSARGQATQALLPVDFEVRENDFVTILGPSGCGKSTLLRIVAGLDFPTAGQVVLEVAADTDGVDVVGQAAFLVREEQAEFRPPLVAVVTDLSGTEPFAHVPHGCLPVVSAASGPGAGRSGCYFCGRYSNRLFFWSSNCTTR